MASNILMGVIFSVLCWFILVNILTGCEDWSKPNCVKPSDIYYMLTK